MVSGEKDVRHRPAVELGRPRVLRELDTALELGGERFDRAALLTDRAGEPARDRVHEHHRGKLAAGEDVWADRDRVGGDVLDDSLVEAFEAGREECQLLLAGELLHEVLVELPTLRRKSDDPPAAGVAVHRPERSVHDIDAQHHARAAPVGLVVHLAAAERREVAIVPEAKIELVPEHGRDGPLLRHPGEGMRERCEDIDLHEGKLVGSAKPRATTMRRRSRSTSRTHCETSGSAWPVSSSRTSFATPGATSCTTPSRRPPSSSTSTPTSSKT